MMQPSTQQQQQHYWLIRFAKLNILFLLNCFTTKLTVILFISRVLFQWDKEITMNDKVNLKVSVDHLRKNLKDLEKLEIARF